MIISASKRTDILAFYFKEFYSLLINNKLYSENPYNKKRNYINKSKIDKIIFWTKLPILDEEDICNLIELTNNYNCLLHFTITGYEADIEPFKKNNNIDKLIELFKKYSNIFRKDNIILRYDPILINNKYNENFHINTLKHLLYELRDYTNKCIISFVDIYSKIKENMKNENVKELSKQEKEDLIKEFLKNDFPLETCAEDVNTIPHTSCISGQIVHGYRKFCNCTKHIDIGKYNTCFLNCKYCYANQHKNNISKLKF